MAYSSKCKRTVFEIQTMEITTLPSPPPKRDSLKKIRITGTEENIFDDKPSIMKDKSNNTYNCLQRVSGVMLKQFKLFSL